MNATELTPYIREKKRHVFYDKSCEYAKDMLIHFDGLKPGKLLSERRPGESKTILDYRLLIYECPTTQDCTKVQNSLMKIRKSQDWVIKYEDDVPSKIKEDESLEKYMEEKFPKFKSFTNWFFQLGFKTYLTDANAIILIQPINKTFYNDEQAEVAKPDNVYYKPYPTQFKSPQIFDYKQNEWYLLESRDKSTYTDGKLVKTDGRIFFYVDKEVITTFTQVDSVEGKMTFKQEDFLHALGRCPIVHFDGEVVDETSDCMLKKSRLSPMLPSFREAVREYSDLQGGVVQHMQLTLWTEQGMECVKCVGTGYIAAKKGAPIKCSECGGHGFYPFNTYETMVKRRAKAGETQIQGDPAGYLKKDMAILELQDKRIFNHRRNGLGAVNMEWLVDVPLNESGKSKEVDRSELNNFVHANAEDVVNIFDGSYQISAQYRYKDILTDTQLEEILPTIPVPEKYEILSETYLVSEIELLKRFNADPAIINASIIEFVNKKFNAEPEIADYVKATVTLDPFSSLNEDYVIQRLQNSGISEQAYVIHCNIKDFVLRAIEEKQTANSTFYSLPLKEQQGLMKKYADEFIKQNSAKEGVMSTIDPLTGKPLNAVA